MRTMKQQVSELRPGRPAKRVTSQIRTYGTGPLYEPRISAHIRSAKHENPQVSEPLAVKAADRVTSQAAAWPN
jgi:hypothetical protein